MGKGGRGCEIDGAEAGFVCAWRWAWVNVLFGRGRPRVNVSRQRAGMGCGASITAEGGRRESRKPLIGIASAWLGIASVLGTVIEGLALSP